jgi:hypothetical protein
MEFNWIVEVLRDLAIFAKKNQLPNTVDLLKETIAVAVLEIPASETLPENHIASGSENIIPINAGNPPLTRR